MPTKNLTPRQIVQALDNHIVGQTKAKRSLAIALRGRWRNKHMPSQLKVEVQPSNILITGPTGVGKTELSRRLAKISNVPFLKIDATQFTERGYVGESVNDIIPRLIAQAYNLVQKEHTKTVQQKADHYVEKIILDALITARANTPADDSHNHTTPPSTQEALKKQLQEGVLEEEIISIQLPKKGPNINILGHGAANEAMFDQVQDLFKQMIPTSTNQKKLTVAKARPLLMEQQLSDLTDKESIREEACRLAQEEGIIFIDEIDKLANNHSNTQGPDVSREGVQRDLLPIIEGTAVPTKHGTINTDHILFIGAGAFHGAKPSDLIPEFQGRFPIRVTLDDLSQKQLLRILQEPKNALIKQYQALFAAEGVTMNLTPEAIEEIAAFAHTCNQNIENIGARRLHTIMNQLFEPHLFDVPDTIGQGAQLLITAAYAKERFAKLQSSQLQQRYIL